MGEVEAIKEIATSSTSSLILKLVVILFTIGISIWYFFVNRNRKIEEARNTEQAESNNAETQTVNTSQNANSQIVLDEQRSDDFLNN